MTGKKDGKCFIKFIKINLVNTYYFKFEISENFNFLFGSLILIFLFGSLFIMRLT